MPITRVLRAIAGSVVIAVCLVVVDAEAQTVRVDYETFCKLDVQNKIRIFNQVTPENKAELVRTQVERWLKQNRSRLTPEQIRIMEDSLALITPDLYRTPKREEDMAKIREVEARVRELFSPEDAAQAFSNQGTCIEKN
jgi:hypothetical protein